MLWDHCMYSVSSSQPQHLPQADVLKMRPFERGSCPAAPRDPPWPAGILEDCVKGLLGLLHTLALTALLTWSPGLTRPRTETQGSRTQGRCSSYNPLLHPGSPDPAPRILVVLTLRSSQVSSLPIFPSLRANPGRYHVYMEGHCCIILAQ